MRKLVALICVLALALVAAGCGSSGGSDDGSSDKDKATTTTTEAGGSTTTADGDGDGGSGEVGKTAEEYEAALVTSLTSGSVEEGDLVIPEEQAECVAPKIVDVVTLEAFQEAGVGISDLEEELDLDGLGLDEEQGQALFDAFETCEADLVARFAESLTLGLDEEQGACVAENVDPDLVEALLVKGLSTGDSDAEFEAVLADLETSCELPGG